eukprot:CAMPEP_0113581822 /NCGR_PEP_ID=MMETSP0015_2-20120614/31535_1 /TAXON_ID=2838 /ORGANISM="Odontella" /LENGTH=66 /DNA_ID=CAMNT_0000486351 /DNA_START=148 /DNA_END=348 /DNA_ORIENTATION=- /assembly_acc=CAM_ASM_000160
MTPLLLPDECRWIVDMAEKAARRKLDRALKSVLHANERTQTSTTSVAIDGRAPFLDGASYRRDVDG